MDAVGEAAENGAFVRVVPYGDGIAAASLEGGSDGGRQRIDHIMLQLAVEPSDQQPGNSTEVHSSLPKRKELLQVGVAATAGAPDKSENLSCVFEGHDISDSLDQDIEKVKVSEATAGRDVEAGPRYPHQDNDDDSVCRICHMNSATAEIVNLGCACKLDLGQAHKRCADTWFAFRGNRECEICGEIAQNVKQELRGGSLVSNPGSVVILNIHYRAFTRWVCIRLLVICLLCVAAVLLLYELLVAPNFKKSANRQV